MPELPDLEIFKKNLQKQCLGKTIDSVFVYREKRLNVSPKELQQVLQGSFIEGIRREGKEIHLIFSNYYSLSVHLMLNGQFHMTQDEAEVPYKHASFKFSDRSLLVFADPRSLLTLHLNPEISMVPDALSPQLTLEYLKQQLAAQKKMPIKGFLVDQDIIRGIGNAYADEILWESRIAPESVCHKIPDSAIIALHQAISSVLQWGIQQLEDACPEALSGEYREFLKIHHPKREVSPTGKPILSKQVASKKTYYSEDQVCYG